MDSLVKILIVDDSTTMLENLKNCLSGILKVETVTAGSLEETKKIFSSKNTDFFTAILDIRLPDAPNGEIIDFIIERGIHPIVITGDLTDETHEIMSERSIIDFVLKGNNRELVYIKDAVERLIENRKRKVLVVDDSKTSRRYLCSLLQRHKLQVYEEENAEAALATLKKEGDFSLALVDYNMPEMNGAQFILQARELYSKHELGIIGISSQGSSSVSVKILKSGADDFILMPFSEEEFYCRINQNIDAVKLFNDLKESSYRDYLTKLHNRKFLFEAGSKLYDNAKRGNIKLTACMIDLDDLKNINDLYDYEAGDFILKHTASIIQDHIRTSDILARIGGKIFCLLIVQSNYETKNRIVETIKEKINSTPVVFQNTPLQITATVGCTTRLADTLDSMLFVAEQALNEARRKGPNSLTRFD